MSVAAIDYTNVTDHSLYGSLSLSHAHCVCEQVTYASLDAAVLLRLFDVLAPSDDLKKVQHPMYTLSALNSSHPISCTDRLFAVCYCTYTVYCTGRMAPEACTPPQVRTSATGRPLVRGHQRKEAGYGDLQDSSGSDTALLHVGPSPDRAFCVCRDEAYRRRRDYGSSFDTCSAHTSAVSASTERHS